MPLSLKAYFKDHILGYIVIISCVFFYTITIRAGQNWGDDFSLYLLHAKNIVTGNPYEQTGYIYNPNFAGYSPKTYPPGYPILLAGVYSIWGMDFYAFKLLNIFLVGILLIALYLIFIRKLDRFLVCTLIAFVGFNPFIWDYKDVISAEIASMAFVYVTFLAINVSLSDKLKRSFLLILNIIIGLLIYICFAIRSNLIILIPCLFFYDVYTYRKIRLSTIITIIVFFLFFFIQKKLIHTDSNYMELLTLGIKDFQGLMLLLSKNIFKYTQHFGIQFYNGYSTASSFFLYLLCLAFSVIGIIKTVREKLTLEHLFFFSLILTVVAWPYFQGTRLLICTIPLFYFYALEGFLYLYQRMSPLMKRYRYILPLFIGALIICTYIGRYLTIDYPKLKADAILDPKVQEMFSYIKTTAKNDVVVFSRPRILALYTGHPGTVYHYGSDKDLWNYFNDTKCKYLIFSNFLDYRNDESSFLLNFIKRNSSHLERVFTNGDFTIYKLNFISFSGSERNKYCNKQIEL